MNLKIIITTSLIILTAAALCAGEEFSYDRGGKRDPFIPLITENARFGIGLAGIETVDDIILEGIVWDEGGASLAILNGIILKENESAGNVKITKIEPKRVTLTINENEFLIDLIEEED